MIGDTILAYSVLLALLFSDYRHAEQAMYVQLPSCKRVLSYQQSKHKPCLRDGHVSILEQWTALWTYSLARLGEEVKVLMNVRCLLSACRCLSPEAWEKRKWPWDRNGPHSSARQSQEGRKGKEREVTKEDGRLKPVSQSNQNDQNG